MHNRHNFGNLIEILFLLHITICALTPLVLRLVTNISWVWPAIYLTVLVTVGGQLANKIARPHRAALLAGIYSQLPGIACVSWIFSGNVLHIATPEVLDFIAQVWQAPFNSVFPLLPRSSWAGIPAYYLVTLLLPFLLPLFPLVGTFLSVSPANRTKKN
jgi:hypothetical protein